MQPLVTMACAVVLTLADPRLGIGEGGAPNTPRLAPEATAAPVIRCELRRLRREADFCRERLAALPAEQDRQLARMATVSPEPTRLALMQQLTVIYTARQQRLCERLETVNQQALRLETWLQRHAPFVPIFPLKLVDQGASR